MCATLDPILIKDWPKRVHGSLFDGQTARVFQRQFITFDEMKAISDEFEEFLAETGFSPSKVADIAIAASEALENARKSLNEPMEDTDAEHEPIPVAVTAITSKFGALIIFVRDHVGMKGVEKMKFAAPPEELDEHGRGSFIMRTLSSFMAIIPEPNGSDKEVILGFCEKRARGIKH